MCVALNSQLETRAYGYPPMGYRVLVILPPNYGLDFNDLQHHTPRPTGKHTTWINRMYDKEQTCLFLSLVTFHLKKHKVGHVRNQRPKSKRSCPFAFVFAIT